MPENKEVIELAAGLVFGRLTITKILAHSRLEAVCVCGTVKNYSTSKVKHGKTKSCGCSHYDRITHGKSRTRLYNSWRSMKQRCLNPKHPHYKDYGGRGIKVCDRWLVFENFACDMVSRPAGTSIERIDNNGNYEASNCRWATMIEQQRNTRKKKFHVSSGGEC